MHPPMGIAACRGRSSLFAAFATATPGGIEMVMLTAPRHRWVMDAPDPRRALPIGFVVSEYERWTGGRWQPARYRELVKGERIRFGEDA